jgi:hypothetical protein
VDSEISSLKIFQNARGRAIAIEYMKLFAWRTQIVKHAFVSSISKIKRLRCWSVNCTCCKLIGLD